MENDIRDQLIVLKVAIIQDQLGMIDELRQLLRSTEDLQTKLKLTSEINTLYVNINKTSVSIENSLPELLVGEEYLDYDKRKSRAQTWRDYVDYCQRNGSETVNKSSFFRHLKKLGFKEGSSGGTIVLVPPGVR